MMIPGSQARLWIGFHAYSNFGKSPALILSAMRVFRFRTINVRPRAPRIDVTNSEGLPGATPGSDLLPVGGGGWPVAPAAAAPDPGPVIPPVTFGGPAMSFLPFKLYPSESQLPGVGVCDVEVEQASWDYSQIVYSFPLAAASLVPIVPQRYISMVIAPNWFRVFTPELWIFPSIYIEEAPHRINVKQDQPVSFTGYTNGPWRYPQSAAGAMTAFPSTGAASGF